MLDLDSLAMAQFQKGSRACTLCFPSLPPQQTGQYDLDGPTQADSEVSNIPSHPVCTPHVSAMFLRCQMRYRVLLATVTLPVSDP